MVRGPEGQLAECRAKARSHYYYYYYYYYKLPRQLLGASWTEGKTNAWVLENIGMESHLLEVIKKETVFFWMRYWGKRMLFEKINITRQNFGSSTSRIQGGPRAQWEYIKWTGLRGDLLLRSAKDRSRWPSIVREAANPRSEDG